MKIHAIQTGQVRIKKAQVEGKGRGVRRQLAIFADPTWTEWLPTFAWVIEHSEGVIVVDTGRGTHLLASGSNPHPYIRWQVQFRIDPQDEVGPQLRRLGIGPRDVSRLVLTHLHIDHDGGLAHFPESEILVARGELDRARGVAGRLRGYLPNCWPTWFAPVPLDLRDGAFGPFEASARLTRSGDVIAVATPGHTAHHLSVIVQDGDRSVFLAGDTSYTEALMLAGRVDGVSADEARSQRTLQQIGTFAHSNPTVYLPSHDPGSADRLSRGLVAVPAAEVIPAAAG